VSVGGIGLAALSGGEHPGTRRQLGWNVNDLLALREQPVRDVPADPLAALDRPHPVRPAARATHHRREAIAIGTEPPGTHNGFVAGHHLDGRERLCGSIPITTRSDSGFMPCSRRSIRCWLSSREGNATSS
jgi:hypothetical protein